MHRRPQRLNESAKHGTLVFSCTEACTDTGILGRREAHGIGGSVLSAVMKDDLAPATWM